MNVHKELTGQEREAEFKGAVLIRISGWPDTWLPEFELGSIIHNHFENSKNKKFITRLK